MLKYIEKILNHEIIPKIKESKVEKVYGIYLKKCNESPDDYEICGFIELGTGSKTGVTPHIESYNRMKKVYFDLGADAMVIMHNHPLIKYLPPCANPSEDDMIATYAVARICMSNKMKLLDHIIIAGPSYFSFVENCLIDL